MGIRFAEGVKRGNQLAAQTASSPLDSPAVSIGLHPMLPLVDRVYLRLELRFSMRTHLAPEPQGVSIQSHSTFRSCICNGGFGAGGHVPFCHTGSFPKLSLAGDSLQSV
jgi:hypothetical protein